MVFLLLLWTLFCFVLSYSQLGLSQICLLKSQRSFQVLLSLFSIALDLIVKFYLRRSYFFSPNRVDLGRVDCIFFFFALFFSQLTQRTLIIFFCFQVKVTISGLDLPLIYSASYLSLNDVKMMHHAVPQGTALCSATSRLPQVKSYTIIWCAWFKESILLKIVVIFLVLNLSFQRLLSMQLYSIRAFEH